MRKPSFDPLHGTTVVLCSFVWTGREAGKITPNKRTPTMTNLEIELAAGNMALLIAWAPYILTPAILVIGFTGVVEWLDRRSAKREEERALMLKSPAIANLGAIMRSNRRPGFRARALKLLGV